MNEAGLEGAGRYANEVRNNSLSNPYIILAINKVDELDNFDENNKYDEKIFETCPFYDQLE